MRAFKVLLVLALLGLSVAHAFRLNGHYWAGDEMHIEFGDLCDTVTFPNTPGDCSGDASNPDWEAAFSTALDRWNAAIEDFTFTSSATDAGSDCSLGDINNPNPNSAFFDDETCNGAFGASTLAISSTTFFVGGEALRNDVVFNSTKIWDVYDGPHMNGVGDPTDFTRVAIHETGHSLGLAHPASNDTPSPIMSAFVGDTFAPEGDDVAGVEYKYGSRANDLDDDRVHDVLIRRSDNGRWFRYELDGQTITESDSVNLTSNLDWDVEATRDFDSDGNTDVLVRNQVNGRWFLYLMDGALVSGSSNMAFPSSLDWRVEVVEDFNNDGAADLLLRNQANGRWRMYLLNGIQILDTAVVDLPVNLVWQTVTGGDFDRDGSGDIMIRRTDNGRWRTYLFDGLTVSSTDLVDIATNAVWQFAAADDFDGDGRLDLLLRRTDNGRWRLYTLDGTQVLTTAILNLPSGSEWNLESTADFNYDGRADALLRDTTNLAWHVYLLDSTTILDNAELAGVPGDSVLQLQAAGDFNDDRRADLLIRNTNNGRWFTYTINGTLVETSGNVGMTTNLVWSVVFTDPL